VAPGRLIARLGLGLICLVVIAWLAVLLRDVRLQVTAGTARGGLAGLISSLRTPGGLTRRIEDLRASRLVDPDLGPQLNIASDLQLVGTNVALIRGRGIAAAVAHQEPHNLDAWVVLEAIDRALGDNAAAARARGQILWLDPRLR
jgi:hypothetical protein